MLIEQVTFSRAAVGVRIVTASELLFNQCEATGPGSDRVTSRSGCATTKELSYLYATFPQNSWLIACARGHGRSIGVHATGGNSVDINWVGGGISFWEFGIKTTDDSGENEASIAVSGDTGFSSNLESDYKANCRSDVRVEGAFTEGSGRFLETQATGESPLLSLEIIWVAFFSAISLPTGSGAAGLLAIRNLRVNTIRTWLR